MVDEVVDECTGVIVWRLLFVLALTFKLSASR